MLPALALAAAGLTHPHFLTLDSARNTHSAADLGAAVQPLFDIGDRLGHLGVYGFAVAAAALSVVLFVRHGVAAVGVAALLLGASYSFLDSHIFSPRGVYTMLVIAAGFGLATWISSAAIDAPSNLPGDDPDSVEARSTTFRSAHEAVGVGPCPIPTALIASVGLLRPIRLCDSAANHLKRQPHRSVGHQIQLVAVFGNVEEDG